MKEIFFIRQGDNFSATYENSNLSRMKSAMKQESK